MGGDGLLVGDRRNADRVLAIFSVELDAVLLEQTLIYRDKKRPIDRSGVG